MLEDDYRQVRSFMRLRDWAMQQAVPGNLSPMEKLVLRARVEERMTRHRAAGAKIEAKISL